MRVVTLVLNIERLNAMHVITLKLWTNLKTW